MADILLRRMGRAGRITLTRPQALNALNPAMCRAMDAALRDWAQDAAIALVIIDAEGPRAFCAGGDIAEIHAEGIAGRYDGARRFWREEYRMNARLNAYPKPVVSLMHGFTMGGGVGIGCHVSHRVLGESVQMAMPECAIGLIPDVGGTYLLARAPGRLGEYLGLTGARMGPGDAILAGFGDWHLPEAQWPDLIADLGRTGDARQIAAQALPPPEAPLRAHLAVIEAWFAGRDLPAIRAAAHASVGTADGAFAERTATALDRASPLAAACTLDLIRAQRAAPDLRAALRAEYRFTYRAPAESDFLEGIRAAVIDKDRKPDWRYRDGVPPEVAAYFTAPLGEAELSFEEETEE